MSRHKAYALSPRDCLKTTLFQKWQRMIAPPGNSSVPQFCVIFMADGRIRYTSSLEICLCALHIRFPLNVRCGVMYGIFCVIFYSVEKGKFKSFPKKKINRYLLLLPLLKILSHTRTGSSQSIVLYLYQTHIRSRLDYGFPMYHHAKKSTLLNSIHHAGIRLFLSAFHTSPSSSLLAEKLVNSPFTIDVFYSPLTS